jgi:hypothetical protein
MPPQTFKLSPSSLNLMKECPRCFWLTQHKVWKRPEGIMASLMSGMDRILKTHFDKFRDKGELPPEIKDHHHTKGLKLFDDKALLSVWRNNFKGISWQDSKGNILHGAVDNILTKGKKLIVLDYKTRGFALKEDTANYYQNQLDIYNFLLQKNSYETEDYAFLLFYIPSHVLETGEVIFENVLARRNVDVKNAETLFNEAIKLLNSECPVNGCEWCERF